MTSHLSTLVEILRWRATHQADRIAYIFLVDGESQTATLSYGELDQRARAIAGHLQHQGLAGERALLLYPSGLEFITAFFGCLYAGAVAVPAYPPKPNRSQARLQAIVADAEARVALTTASILDRLEGPLANAPNLRGLYWLDTEGVDLQSADLWQPPLLGEEATAFLQYTSGSTGTPRGVMVSHANLMHNQRLIARAFGHTETSTVVSWLPRYHDMGLIGDTFQPLYMGALSIFMSPVAFLQEPFRWLLAISRYRAHTSGAPNFAYDLCVRQIAPERRAALDLSSWQVAYNGAEPVRAETLERFAEAFAGSGFRREALFPCYGLAEATLFVTGSAKGAGPRFCHVDELALQENRVEPAPGDSPVARRLVSCGQPGDDTTIAVVNPESLAVCSPGQVGEICVAGGSVARGYWRRPEESQLALQARLPGYGDVPFLRTGDLGFLREGELYITGRLKDLIIIRGRNYYPQDIEQAIERSHPALRPAAGVAFTVEPDHATEGGERLVVVNEVERQWVSSPPVEEIARAICGVVAEQFELRVHAVVLLKPGGVPKTSSGKVQRRACRESLLAGTLGEVAQWTAPTHLAEMDAETTLPPGSSAEAIGTWLRHWIAREIGLEVDAVDLRQTFFHYGLDSMRLTRLAYDLGMRLGFAMPAALIWEHPTLEALARRVFESSESAAAATNGAAAPPPDEIPLSPGQAALWFLHKLAPESEAYILVVAVRIRPQPDIPALKRAADRLIARHEALRTTFVEAEGQPVQRVRPDGRVPFAVVDASAWNAVELEARLSAEARQPFDLEHGPVVRIIAFAGASEYTVLMLVMHHIAGDYASLVVLMDELRALYWAETTRTPAELPAPSATYADYVHRQAEMLAGPEGERLWDYWRNQLAGDLPVLNLPADYPRPAVQTFHGGSQTFTVEAGLTRRLRQLARTEGASLYMLLLAAFQILLWRYSGQEDFLVGSLTAGRTRREFSRLVGYLVNPVVLRANLSGDPALPDFLARVRSTALGALAHQDYPFPTLVKQLRPNRDPSRSPLFDVLFSLHQPQQFESQTVLAELLAPSPAGPAVKWAGLQLEPVALPQQEGQFDLALELAEGAASLAGAFKYNTDIFTPRRVGQMIGHFLTLLASMVAEPCARLSQLAWLTEAERHQVLVTWNATRAPYPQDQTLPQLLSAQADRVPDAVAVEFEGRTLTYRELHAQANRVAGRLRRLGVGPDTLVGLCVDRSPDMAVGLLGILKAGGAYVPLDPAWPAERLEWVLADTGEPVVVAQEHLWSADRHSPRAGQMVFLETDDGAAEPVDALPIAGLDCGHLAYTIYTSGSTGRPKGVQISHRAVINFLHAMRQRPGLAEDDVLLAVTPLTFDIAGLELLLPWSVGARVVIASRAIASDGERLAAELERCKATVMQATPATWQLLIESGWRGNPRLKCLCGGEALTRELADELLPRCASVWNMYGPTETTIWSTVHRVQPGEPISLGRPIANTEIFLLDKHRQPVPIGVPGDLHIGGAGLARGYLNRPELTAEKFIPHPFSTDPRARLYNTGDIARYRPDGCLEYLGRSDYQVKIRGHRIEPGEIEAALREHPAVGDAVVVAHTVRPGDIRLAAYIVPCSDLAPDPADLRRFLHGKLPEHMLPGIWVMMEALPRTPHGKVDRRALPAPEGQVAHAPATPPQTRTESVLAAIWQELLQVDRVNVHDNFFELGGHSLLLIQVRDRLQAHLGQTVSMVELFQYPTIRALAEHMDGVSRPLAAPGAERARLRLERQAAAQERRERRQRHRADES